MANPALDEALHAVALGYAVVPNKNKKPLIEGWTNGSALATEKDIEEFWRKMPDANNGIRTGNGLIVIDIDGPEGERCLRELERKYGKLSPTYVVRTKRGRHLYFRGAYGFGVGAGIRPGIDYRADGGYVVGAGSEGYTVESGSLDKLALLPEWVADLISASRTTAKAGTQHYDLVSLAGTLWNKDVTVDELTDMLWSRASRFPQLDPTWPWRREDCEKIARSAEDKWSRGTQVTLRLIPFAELDTSPPLPLLLDRISPVGQTMIFGDGGTGKGSIVASWIVRLAHEGRRVLVVDYENHPEEWGSRTSGLGIANDVASLFYINPLSPEYAGKHGPLWNMTEQLKPLIDGHGIDLIVVDSVVQACMGLDPSAPEAVVKYTQALDYFKVPYVSIAHVNRAKDLSKPYGSAFWHNYSRMTWSLEQDGDKRTMMNRKANRYRHRPAQDVQLVFKGDMLTEVIELPETLSAQLHGMLSFMGQATVADLAGNLNQTSGTHTSEATVRKTLNAHKPLFEQTGTAQKAVWVVRKPS